jgi:alpha-L-rhamnosidase
MNDDFPSWLYQVKLGATTMWERWDGWRPDKGFQDPAMNSFNHYAFGSVGQWLYESVAGIEPLAPGYRKIRFAPIPGKPLEHAKATFKSTSGDIASSWKKTNAGIEYDFIVPPNTSAEARLLAEDPSKVTESGKPATDSAQVKLIGRDKGTVTFLVPSGHYHFVVPETDRL